MDVFELKDLDSPSSATIDLMEKSDVGSSADGSSNLSKEKATSADRDATGSVTSSSSRGARVSSYEQVVQRLRSANSKSRMEMLVLREALERARATDIELLTSQFEDVTLDLRRTRQRNLELKERLRDLESDKVNGYARGSLRGKSLPVQPTIEKDNREAGINSADATEIAIPPKASKMSVKFDPSVDVRVRRLNVSEADAPSSYKSVLASLPSRERQVVIDFVEAKLEKARLTDRAVIAELSSQLRELLNDADTIFPTQRSDMVDSAQLSANEDASDRLPQTTETTTGSSAQHILLWFCVGAVSMLLCCAIAILHSSMT